MGKIKRKFRKALAACALMPAGIAGRPGLRRALAALLDDPRGFFSATLHFDEQRLGHLAAKSLLLGRKLMQWAPEKIPAGDPGNTLPTLHVKKLPAPSIEELLAAIADDSVKVVSFDIFDTLLLRATLTPLNVFSLVAGKLDKPLGVNFVQMRADAEARLKSPNASFDEIWDFIAKEYGLAPELRAKLQAAEMACEDAVLMPHPAMAEVFAGARRLGKRIIGVSDMYLPSSFLERVLKRHDLAPDAIYVSCECAGRKDTGALYDHVLKKEGLEPGQMIHIGDNRHSDCEVPLSLGIPAIWRPSPRDLAMAGRDFGEVFPHSFLWTTDGIFPGLAIAMLFGGANRPESIWQPRDVGDFALAALAPIVTAFCARLIDEAKKAGHDEILFSGRDGWLPWEIYKILAGPDDPKATYFQAGRRAFLPLASPDFFAYAKNCGPEITYEFEDFLKAYFADAPFYERMIAALPASNLRFHEHRDKLEALLGQFADEINEFQRQKAARALKYYQKIFAGQKPLIVDTGYSGSIGSLYRQVTGKPAHKAYFWQEEKNRNLDAAEGSSTICFFESLDHLQPGGILLEELFSPPEGGCIGFDEAGDPVCEKIAFDPSQIAAHGEILAQCAAYARKFREVAAFSPPPKGDIQLSEVGALPTEWDSHCNEVGAFQLPTEGDSHFNLALQILSNSNSGALAVFRDIAFPDPIYRHRGKTLESKLEEMLFNGKAFAGTGFEKRREALVVNPGNPGRIGVHLHAHFPELLQECLYKLKDLPLPFDLYVTSSNARLAAPLADLSRCFLGRPASFIEVPNRGRDIAPWLVEMREIQKGYDLFGHLHAKKSREYIHGEAWREFLFDELVGKSAKIFSAFAANPGLGCVVPPFFPPLYEQVAAYPSVNTPREQELVDELLARLGYDRDLARAETIYSAGTMFWYRPAALARLFGAGFGYEDFECEPIGVANSIAHALERLPCVVASRDGWQCRMTGDL